MQNLPVKVIHIQTSDNSISDPFVAVLNHATSYSTIHPSTLEDLFTPEELDLSIFTVSREQVLENSGVDLLHAIKLSIFVEQDTFYEETFFIIFNIQLTPITLGALFIINLWQPLNSSVTSHHVIPEEEKVEVDTETLEWPEYTWVIPHNLNGSDTDSDFYEDFYD